MHNGDHVAILSQRLALYEQSKMKNPSLRISGKIRNWSPAGDTLTDACANLHVWTPTHISVIEEKVHRKFVIISCPVDLYLVTCFLMNVLTIIDCIVSEEGQ